MSYLELLTVEAPVQCDENERTGKFDCQGGTRRGRNPPWWFANTTLHPYRQLPSVGSAKVGPLLSRRTHSVVLRLEAHTVVFVL